MASLSPYQLLKQLADASRHQAKGLPAQEDAREYWSGIGFVLGGQHFVAHMDNVAEILRVPSFTKLPGVKRWVRGVANVRGRLVPIMDLLTYIGQKADPAHRKSRRAIIIDADDITNGLIIDGIEGMQHFPVEEFASVTVQTPDLLKPYIQGQYVKEGRTWIVINPRDLVASEEFMQVAN